MPKMGITRLANITGLDFINLPVFVAVRANSRMLSNAQGKGLDIPSAQASALMEAAEGWHAERMDIPIRYESPMGMRRRVTIGELQPLLRDPQCRLQSHRPIMWVEGYDLLQNVATWVPLETVSLYFVEGPFEERIFDRSSKGLASGNSLIEAIAHAIYELCERHSIAEHKSLRAEERSAKRIDRSTITDPLCQSTLNILTKAGLEPVITDITGSLGVPTFECAIVDRDVTRWSSRTTCGGFGCHLDPALALIRALTEAVQARATKIAGMRDDLFNNVYEMPVDDLVLHSLSEEFRLEPLRPECQQKSLATQTFEGDIEILKDRIKEIGLNQMIAVDLTKPELGLPVAKVVVPGSRSMREGVRRPPNPE